MKVKNNQKEKIEICILAAGMGSRMKSDKPKVLHALAGRPLLQHLVDTVQGISPEQVHVVVGNGADQVKQAFNRSKINWVLQEEQRGTGHAVMQALPDIAEDARILILLGDAPLIDVETIMTLVSADCDLGILTVNLENPFNYGRIVRGDGEQVRAIVEEKMPRKPKKR